MKSTYGFFSVWLVLFMFCLQNSGQYYSKLFSLFGKQNGKHLLEDNIPSSLEDDMVTRNVCLCLH